MKRILVLFVMSFFLINGAAALAADDIGFIDMEKLLINYKGAKAIQEDLQKAREAYQTVFEEKQKELQKAKEQGKSEEELKAILVKIEEELKPKRDEMIKHEQEVQMRLLGKIVETGKLIAKDYGIDVVVDKRVVYVGGFDLTDFILEKLE
ncbi:OmpH family outer membrane protein [Thermoproteota archaeon]